MYVHMYSDNLVCTTIYIYSHKYLTISKFVLWVVYSIILAFCYYRPVESKLETQLYKNQKQNFTWNCLEIYWIPW